MLGRTAWHAVLMAAALALSGCLPKDREPVPVIQITVPEHPSEYVIDGRRLSAEEAQAELQILADKHRRPTTGSARAYVRVWHHPRASYARVETVVGWCQRMGLDKVTVLEREGDLPAEAGGKP
ncbi:MAG: hypothetical protein H0W72_09915 [Planctomycetes bacterium]|nr:hypothetical protein [Planctomycetota bacterium]